MAAIAVLVLAACGGGTATQPTPAPSPTPGSLVYAAVGASDTVGVGATDPAHDAWPAVFARAALPTARYRNFGISGERVAGALVDELPKVLNVKPAVVTVWLNVNDITAGVPVAEYQAQLTELVHALRQGGTARVLVANTPYLDRLPVYVSCRTSGTANGVACPGRATTLAPDAVNALVDSYNVAIAAMARQEGADLVDLHAQGEVPDLHPEFVSKDGFHPSSRGYAAVAGAFVARYQQAR